MFRSCLFVLVIPCFLALSGCGESPAPAAPAAAAATTLSPVAAAGAAAVVPGSHEDWCPEHAVPESVCTRCDAKLIPAFKATKDWCPEHALPESQCLKCNPGLRIMRPAKPAAR